MAEKTRYLTFNIVVWIIDAEHIGTIRDEGLVQSAIERPATTILGSDAYPDLAHKAAALLHSVCLNHALIEGNKRLAAILALVFLEINGSRCSLSNDALFELVMNVASGSMRDVGEIASALRVTGL